MTKHILIIGTFLLAIGGLVFFDQVIAVFQGMTILAALQFILNYVLHVAVVTIAAFVIFGLPEIFKPWLRMLRRKQRAARRGLRTPPTVSTSRAPRINKDAVLMWMASRMGQSPKQPPQTPTPPANDVQFKL